MPFLVSYLLKLSISLSAVWFVYWFLLRRLTFYNWNRYFLLLYSMLAFVIPFIDISSLLQRHEMNNTAVLHTIPSLFVESGDAVTVANGPDYWKVGTVVFAIGMTGMLVRLILQYTSLYRIRKGATLLHAEGLKLYHVNEHIMPFSFGDSIFVNQHLHQEEELREIIRHEFIHVKQKHSVDILFGELLCMLNWYNPFAWLIRNAIRQNLEFIADSAVLSNGMEKKAYQYLLLKVTGGSQFTIATNFNFSSLKKRIAMMNKKQSAKLNLIRFLLVLPVISIVVLAFRGSGDAADRNGSFRYAYITDTVPPPPPPPDPPEAPSLPDGVRSINVANGKATVTLDNGKVENYNLNSAAGKAEFEEKYGKMIAAPAVPARGVTAVIAQGRPMPPQLVHPGIQKDYRDFLRRNDQVENVQWMDKPLRIVITLEDGTKEVYNTENAEEKRRAEAKYGKLPTPPPPPPPPPAPPAPPRPATSVKQSGGSTVIVDAINEPVVAQGYRAAAREAVIATTGQTVATNEPVVVQGYRAAAKEAVTASGGQTVATNEPVVVQGYRAAAREAVTASPAEVSVAGRPSVKRVAPATSVTQLEADEIVIHPDGNVVVADFDLQMIAKFTAGSTQEDIDKIAEDLLAQGYKFSTEQVVFKDGKLVRLAATIRKGNDNCSFNASDFSMLLIGIQKKNGKNGIHVFVRKGKVTV